MVLLDVRTRAADPATFERMVSAAASIVVACRKRGDRVRLVTTDGVDHAADTIAGCDAILDLLAIVEQTKTASVSLPFRIGRSGAETGAMVVADNAETLIASMKTGRAVSGGTYVVRFRLEGANVLAGSTRLTSSRMINIEQGDDFVAAWTQAIRRR